MRVNDLNKKITRTIFSMEMTIEDDGEGFTYVFPDTKEFIAMANRKFINRELVTEEKT
ncbi:MAG: hypothetical protein ACFFAS_19160 [Promethearchaeota archaeon]